MAAITASQSAVEAKLQQFCEEIRQGQEEPATKAMKQARYEKPYTFRRHRNEEQATFNAKLKESLAQAESELLAILTAPWEIMRCPASLFTHGPSPGVGYCSRC